MSAIAEEIPLSERGPAPTRIVVSFGFWLFLLSDIVIFSALFAAYAVLAQRTAGGPSGAQLFDLKNVFIETCCLLASRGINPARSAFLSAFFGLVGTHGIHVTAGLCWLAVMMAQIATLGLRPKVVQRLVCFSLFWHALDLVWIGVFTIVYLGART